MIDKLSLSYVARVLSLLENILNFIVKTIK